ncbi:MAG: hypothetical protein ACOCVH_00875 [Verrucomicrobiota bacterium]
MDQVLTGTTTDYTDGTDVLGQFTMRFHCSLAYLKFNSNPSRLRLLKIGARIEVGKTFIGFHFPASYPLQPLLARTSAMLYNLKTS